jgi:hypothetical protein
LAARLFAAVRHGADVRVRPMCTTLGEDVDVIVRNFEGIPVARRFD